MEKQEELGSVELDVNAKLSEINQLIVPYQLAYVSPSDDCLLLERNARYMTKEQQDRLTSNVKHDGFLSQLPFGIKQSNGKYKIISGNHRVKAAVKAGLDKILILYGNELDFDEKRQLAVQISHNSISGQDDLVLLKSLYMDLDDLFLKQYSGIDEKLLFDCKTLDLSAIAEKDLELYSLTFMFCEANRDNVEHLLEALDQKVGLDGESTSIVVGDPDRFISIMSKVQKQFGIKNRSTALLKMCEICERAIKAIEQEETCLIKT
ncbi:MAG: ParB N-terminal domain-containing protein [Planctomycetaceae bacterium]|jgi:hypothetical protein|nr:ParB N-terminal domain-containing protein [Planctomycetaceae bacterium]